MPIFSIDEDSPFIKQAGIKKYHGYEVPFSRKQVKDAKFKNGTYVRKVKSVTGDEHDEHGVGEIGLVLGSISTDAIPRVVGYFVSFNDKPKYPVLVLEAKLEAAEAPPVSD
jgi:hypothetical protein